MNLQDVSYPPLPRLRSADPEIGTDVEGHTWDDRTPKVCSHTVGVVDAELSHTCRIVRAGTPRSVERGSWAATIAILLVLTASAFVIPAHAKIPADQLAKLPPAASRPVDFDQEIRPILEASCVKCHGRGKSKGGFQLDTRETFLRDGDSGPAVKLGDSAGSRAISQCK